MIIYSKVQHINQIYQLKMLVNYLILNKLMNKN